MSSSKTNENLESRRRRHRHKYDPKDKLEGQEQSQKASPSTIMAHGVVDQAEWMRHENVLPGEDQRGRTAHRKGYYERGMEPSQQYSHRDEYGGMAMDEQPRNSFEFDIERNQSNESSQRPGSIDHNDPRQHSPALRRIKMALKRDDERRERNRIRRQNHEAGKCVLF